MVNELVRIHKEVVLACFMKTIYVLSYKISIFLQIISESVFLCVGLHCYAGKVKSNMKTFYYAEI
jgi:hypothetical protein